MRRIAFALVLMIVSGWSAPSQAQWWGGGWGRPCFGACRPWRDGGGWAGPRRFVVGVVPRPTWGGPVAFGPPRFWAGGWGWRRFLWRREMRRRRLEAWRRWADAGRDAAPPPETERSGVRHPARWRSPLPSDAVATPPRPPRAEAADLTGDERRAPGRAEAVVAIFPAGALHLARPKGPAAMPSRVLAAAAMLRRPPVPAPRPAPVAAAVVRPPEPPVRPAPAALRPAASPPSSADVRPVVLRNQPAAAPTPAPAAASPEPAAPEPGPAAPADVPVAPLD